MQRLLDQHYSIKFGMKLNKSASDAHAMIREACKEHAMPRARVSEWNKKFIDGRDGVADEDRSGRPSTSRTDKNVEKVRLLLNTDRRFIPQLIAEDLNLSKTSVYGIVTEELNMQKVCAKLVPKAPSHTSFVASEVLARNKIVTMPRPPYSPDLTPSDFFLFPRMKRDMKGNRYGTVEEVQAAPTRVLRSIPVSEF